RALYRRRARRRSHRDAALTISRRVRQRLSRRRRRKHARRRLGRGRAQHCAGGQRRARPGIPLPAFLRPLFLAGRRGRAHREDRPALFFLGSSGIVTVRRREEERRPSASGSRATMRNEPLALRFAFLRAFLAAFFFAAMFFPLRTPSKSARRYGGLRSKPEWRDHSRPDAGIYALMLRASRASSLAMSMSSRMRDLRVAAPSSESSAPRDRVGEARSAPPIAVTVVKRLRSRPSASSIRGGDDLNPSPGSPPR